ncbi:hypothetical protein [Novosphingobium beihaiensis]|uniref:Uncharacterized protein n=1 Tax=Novosphingobium beihaiensis TaxID=2930389 RepID=A0ABT0BLU1_9SPHN|nr:hypothetical protein [Novosphingobium beihaiensis]MCJ2186017.1 hypothetical protein [Novosphingobium beihaiensis]
MIDKTPRPERRPKSLPAFTPVPRKCERHDGWTAERQRGFIEALADTDSVRAAAHAVNMTPEGAYLLRRHPEGKSFRKAWQAALSFGVQRLEDAAMERALYGIEVPVYCYGKVIGTRRVFNDALLMFLLRNRAPHRFAADSLHNLDAATQSSLRRLKKEWRQQWEEEKQAEASQSSEEILNSIDAQIDKMRQRHQATMSARTRRLWQAYQKSTEADSRRSRALPAPNGDEEEDDYRED